jgi:transcriptional regulator with PAS, ATPase and Fis domain
MSVDTQGRVLVSTHDLERAGALRKALKGVGYTVELVTPGEDVSGDIPIQLLVITADAGSESAHALQDQACELYQAPSFAMVDDADSLPRLAHEYTEAFSSGTRPDDIVVVARALIERRRLQAMAGIVGETDPMKEALERVVQFAPVASTVLVTGESGTGKELVARGIHNLSPRRHKPFIAVNVAALSETLLESEIFGHEKGAFTGAIDSRKGLFELADKGTIFLDEIGEMPLATQTKLLRVLEQREFYRVGGEAVIRVDVRIVTATNKDLKQLVAVGQFRKDLYYRLNVLHIELPPLRRRREDIPLLVEAFIKEASARHDRTFAGISAEAMKILVEYHWPGNIRELQNLIESMVVLAPGREVQPEDIPREVRALDGGAGALVPVGSGSQRPGEALEQGIRPELEFIFRTLVDLRMDVDDLRQDFDVYRDKDPILPAAIEPYRPGGGAYLGSAPGVEIGIRPRGGEDDPWVVGDSDALGAVEVPYRTEAVEVEPPGTVVYRSGMTMEDLEREAIIAALEEVRGNRRKAAQILAIGERTLYRKIKKFGLDDD